MKWQVQWTPEQRKRADAEGLSLWAVGYRGAAGRYEATGLMEDGIAQALFRFGHELYRGKSPAEAFAEAWPEDKPDVHT
jgi:hypothetical protein